MFNTILNALTSKLPLTFLLASYVPVIIFGFLNGALLSANVPGFRDLASAQVNKPSPFLIGVLFVGSLVVAYVISTVVDALREFLQGRYIWPRWLADALRRDQQKQLASVENRLEEARANSRAVTRRTTMWQATLREAARIGTDAHPHAIGYARPNAASTAIDDLRRHRSAGDNLRADRLAAAVGLLKTSLTQFDVTEDLGLDQDFQILLNLIDYGSKNAAAEELRCFTLRQTQFGLVTPEPTRLGNVAAGLESYTVSRYGLDLNTLWSRLQPVIQKNNKDAFNTIADAKTQLDFLVTCCWLCALTTIVWVVALAFMGRSPVTFLVIAAGGPALVAGFYSLAVTNYLSYGELIRAAVDLNRFALLKELHIAAPDGIRQERTTWTALRQLSSFGTPGIELSYEHDS